MNTTVIMHAVRAADRMVLEGRAALACDIYQSALDALDATSGLVDAGLRARLLARLGIARLQGGAPPAQAEAALRAALADPSLPIDALGAATAAYALGCALEEQRKDEDAEWVLGVCTAPGMDAVLARAGLLHAATQRLACCRMRLTAKTK
jgi:hypothetical protein